MTEAAFDLLDGHSYVTDGGMETDFIFRRGVDLPEFAAFPLLDSATGRQLLSDYYADYASIAASAASGLMLESPTWRANLDWGRRLGYDEMALARVNRAAVALLRDLAQRWADAVPTILVSGMIGPRGDGYQAEARMGAQESADYHRAQVAALSGADLVTAYTLTHAGEAAGIALAADEAGVPVAISFTVETDGRLPDGSTLAAAIDAVDRQCPPSWFLVNCAHPNHLRSAFAGGGAWLGRIAGVRVNASTLSHAELDEATTLDDGDPSRLAVATDRLRPMLPGLAIVGGCCGTDARHVAAQWKVADPTGRRFSGE